MQGRDDAASFVARVRGRRPATSSTTSSTRCSSASPTTSATSCSATVDPRPAHRPAVRRGHRRRRRRRRRSRRSTGPTCSSSRSTTGGAGTATTTCSPTCCGHGSSTSTRTRSPSCTGGRAPGGRAQAIAPRRSPRARRRRPRPRRRPDRGGGPRRCGRTRQEATLRRWLDALPERALRRPAGARDRPRRGAAVDRRGPWRGGTACLRRRALASRRRRDAGAGRREAAGMIVRHPTALGHLPSAIALYRAALAQAARRHPRRRSPGPAALASGPRGPAARARRRRRDPRPRHLDGRRPRRGHGAWSPAVVDLDRAGHRADMLGGYLAMADIRARPRAGSTTRGGLYERGLRLGLPRPTPPLRGTADMHVGLAEVRSRAGRPRGGARAQLDASAAARRGAGPAAAPVPVPRRAWRGCGRPRATSTRPHRARSTKRSGSTWPTSSPTSGRSRPFAPAVGPHRAGIGDALAWARNDGLTVDDDPDVPARVRARHAGGGARRPSAGGTGREAAPSARRFIDRLLARPRRVDGVAVRHRAPASCGALAAPRGRRDASRRGSLDRALALAEPEGYVRVFLDDGPSVTALLAAPGARRPASAHGSRGARRRRAAVRRQPLVEPLSDRELDVLRLLAERPRRPGDRGAALRLAQHAAHAHPATSSRSSA